MTEPTPAEDPRVGRMHSAWAHEDGSRCDAGFVAPFPPPDAAAAWWCVIHEQHLRPLDG